MEDDRLPPPRSVYRVLSRTSAWERIGVGVMDKSGIAVDHRDFDARAYSLVYVLRGSGSYRDESGREHPLRPGDCFQRQPGRLHTTTLDPASRWLEAWIDFGPTLFAALVGMQVVRRDPPVWHWGLAPSRVARFTALIAELDSASDRELPDLCVRCQALVVEAQKAVDAQRVAAGDDPVERLCRLLAAESGTRLDLRAFCRRENVDYERLRRDFRTRLGVSPGQYRIGRRMERACALLQTTSRPIAAIADELGYHSAYEFSAQFRQWMGMPPSRYRAS